ncbi:type II toxin-antitoxin system RelE/ParE family toxin [Pseudomonas turukhanskensis]|uniref:Plasmid stabilization protein n=1 Tax=Pseudomonas turukhanskensis TaxID=1806536 RepID=A0A9W6K923_9PSED|nr:type II toxin-antitoxin system RelE/ParE family toxin [Pseudomonas turukhanskensis]GLK91022.1 hypothetical protein GCM10017655_40860 [Pseudomonas turukhanskensis]
MAPVPAAFEVVLTNGAERDLETIYEYICEVDSVSSANYVLDGLTDVVETLARFPDRGGYPKELLALGVKEFRQVFFKPYRAIYQTIGNHVVISVIADGRRDISTLLTRRLLSSL